MTEAEKLNIDSIIARLLEGKIKFLLHFGKFHCLHFLQFAVRNRAKMLR